MITEEKNISFVYIYFACFAIFRFGSRNKFVGSYKINMQSVYCNTQLSIIL